MKSGVFYLFPYVDVPFFDLDQIFVFRDTFCLPHPENEEQTMKLIEKMLLPSILDTRELRVHPYVILV